MGIALVPKLSLRPFSLNQNLKLSREYDAELQEDAAFKVRRSVGKSKVGYPQLRGKF